MSAFAIVKSILKAQNEALLRQIAQKYELDEEELMSKYFRPTFFIPDMTDAPAVISYSYKELKTTRKKTIKHEGGEGLSTTPAEDPR